MNTRLLVVAGIILTLLAAFAYIISSRDPGFTITNATANLSSQPKPSVSVFFNIDNKGKPDLLRSASSTYADKVIIVRPEQFDTTVIPAASSAVFSSDGVYLKLTEIRDDLQPGDLVPVTLSFQNAGKITFKAMVKEPSGHHMDHAGHHGEDTTGSHPVPQIALSVSRKQDQTGWQINVTTENFSFYKPQDTAPHAPGQGHAHIYLNGLKLQRLYGNSASFGNLPSGTYTVNVTLNTNTHNVYMANGKELSAEAIVTSD